MQKAQKQRTAGMSVKDCLYSSPKTCRYAAKTARIGCEQGWIAGMYPEPKEKACRIICNHPRRQG